jgi:mono/diheme cytochrome c family protein
MQYKRSRKIVENLNGVIPDSISKMPYMKKKHQDIKEHLITQKEVKGLFNCTACHQNAKKGIFSDDDVKIPNYGRWEKN